MREQNYHPCWAQELCAHGAAPGDFDLSVAWESSPTSTVRNKLPLILGKKRPYEGCEE